MRIAPYHCFAVALVLSASAVVRADDPMAGPRAEFRQAWTAADAGLPATGPDSAALQAYVLYPYLQGLRLRRALARNPADGTLDPAIETFLDHLGGNDLPGRDLRENWLKSLAQRGDWARFQSGYQADANDVELNCDALQARIALKQYKGLPAAIIDAWRSPNRLPDACNPVFDWLRDQGGLSDALIEQRARLALAAGNAALARELSAQLPKPQAQALLIWAALIDSPAATLDGLIADPSAPVEPAALLDGWQRLARRDPDGAADRWDRLVASRLHGAAAASPYARALALGLAWSRKPLALRWFAQIEPADLDTVALEWWARSALWAGDWGQAEQVIGRMPPALRDDPRWRYWAGRAAKRRNAGDADAQLGQLAAGNGRYAALAAAALGKPYAPSGETLHFDPQAEQRLAALPGFVRARELRLAALEPLAALEWLRTLNRLTDADRVQAIGLARQMGWYDQAIATASRQSVFDDYTLLYPRPYDGPVTAAAQRAELPAPLIYGVLRQESLYRADAVSRANAYGLMQLLSGTAKRTARHWDLPVPADPNALFDPQTNILLGSAHLRELVDRFAGQTPVALAAYNAGPGAAQRWLPAQGSLPADVWIENIPYNETRNYVGRVLWHALVFAWRSSGKAQKLDDWLAPITPIEEGS